MNAERPYLKPNWMQRNVASKLVPRIAAKVVGRITVVGRTTGRPHTTAIAPHQHDDATYLVSVFGITDWALDLRADGRCRIDLDGTTTEYVATEVPVEERPAILATYLEAFGKFPNVTPAFEKLPDPATHPTFRLQAASAQP